MTELTPEQRTLLTTVAAADTAWRRGRADLEARLRASLEAELDALAAQRRQAVLRAVAAGVPKRRIHLDGLHTKSPNAVYELLADGEAATMAAAAGVTRATEEERAAAQEQPGELLARTPKGLVLYTDAAETSQPGKPEWHAVHPDGRTDAPRTREVRADAGLLAELDALRATME